MYLFLLPNFRLDLLMLGAKMSPEKRTKGLTSWLTALTAVRNLAAPPTGSTLRSSTLYTSLKWIKVSLSALATGILVTFSAVSLVKTFA